jgi:hypothetical protein
MKFLLWALLTTGCASSAFAGDVANPSAAANAATVVSVRPAALLSSNDKAGGTGDKGQGAKLCGKETPFTSGTVSPPTKKAS